MTGRDLRTLREACGITREELVDGLAYGGAATYVADAAGAKITLFV